MADRREVFEAAQSCDSDAQCAAFSRQELMGSGCGVLSLRGDRAAKWAEQEKELAEEADEECDEDEADDLGEELGQAIGDAIACGIQSAFVSQDPADYTGQCNEGVCAAVLKQ
jgi:hypothetical protein